MHMCNAVYLIHMSVRRVASGYLLVSNRAWIMHVSCNRGFPCITQGNAHLQFTSPTTNWQHFLHVSNCKIGNQASQFLHMMYCHVSNTAWIEHAHCKRKLGCIIQENPYLQSTPPTGECTALYYMRPLVGYFSNPCINTMHIHDVCELYGLLNDTNIGAQHGTVCGIL